MRRRDLLRTTMGSTLAAAGALAAPSLAQAQAAGVLRFVPQAASRANSSMLGV